MKYLIALMVSAFIVLFTCLSFAAGTVDGSIYMTSLGNDFMVLKVECTGDASDGSVPDTVLTLDKLNYSSHGLPYAYWLMGYCLHEVWVVAGSPAPDAADLTIEDAIDAVLFTEVGVIAASGTNEGTVTSYRTVTSALEIKVANQATANARYDIYIKLRKCGGGVFEISP